MKLSGQNILVTGGSRGIGAAICRAVAEQGARVCLHYARNDQAAREVLASLTGTGHEMIQTDLTEASAGRVLFKGAVDLMGHIDTVVNNAGIMPEAGVEHDIDQWNRVWQDVMQANVMAVGDICREAILHFKNPDFKSPDFKSPGRKGGRIVNIASRAAYRGDDPNYMHYAASKSAVVALTKSIARGFGRDNIIAVNVAPGWVESDMSKGFIDEYGLEAATKDIPLGEISPPEEVGELVAYLCSPTARQITGATFDINGASYVR